MNPYESPQCVETDRRPINWRMLGAISAALALAVTGGALWLLALAAYRGGSLVLAMVLLAMCAANIVAVAFNMKAAEQFYATQAALQELHRFESRE